MLAGLFAPPPSLYLLQYCVNGSRGVDFGSSCTLPSETAIRNQYTSLKQSKKCYQHQNLIANPIGTTSQLGEASVFSYGTMIDRGAADVLSLDPPIPFEIFTKQEQLAECKLEAELAGECWQYLE